MAAKPFRILLVRHGESAVNVNTSLTQTVADHAVSLTPRGFAQARGAGEFLREYLQDRMGSERRHVRLWQSPYLRARQTADTLLRGVGPGLITDRREDINLTEQQFGLFDGIPDEELPRRFPAEWAHYKKCERHSGRFWARMPLGESRFDVAVRVRQFFPTLHQDREDNGILDLVIVSHGVTIRAFLMQWLHLGPEWFEAEPNPGNCYIRLIEGGVDRGYVYKGELEPRPARTSTTLATRLPPRLLPPELAAGQGAGALPMALLI